MVLGEETLLCQDQSTIDFLTVALNISRAWEGGGFHVSEYSHFCMGLILPDIGV